MRRALVLFLVAGCPSSQPPTVNEPPRLDAVESCSAPAPATASLPVPVRPPGAYPWAELGFRDASGYHPATFLCDLPSRVIALAQRGKGGEAYAIPRPSGATQVASIQPSSKGCTPTEVTCTWATGLSGAPTIDTLKGPQWVAASGWVHGVEDMCRALPDDTIAVCSTAKRLAYVEVGCPTEADPVPLQLGLHDESLPRNYDLDVEVPVARLYGHADPPAGDRWSYRFTGAGTRGADKQLRFTAAALTIDLAAHTGVLELDGQREDCIAFGLFRR